jgi:hypothetical protein
LGLIDVMVEIAEAGAPMTGRSVGYKLFSRQLIPSMKKNPMQAVYRLLKEAREEGIIPWGWIVDETRLLEEAASWDNPDEFVQQMRNSYRREFWNQQPCRVEVWSEKGTVRGVLAPVLDQYGVGFRVLHGFSGATTVHEVAEDDDGRPLNVLYVGDYDPSEMYMSERDLPDRLAKYDGDHVEVKRIALLREDVEGLISFPASDKSKDTRYKWFVQHYGHECWELDAMDPNDLRARVEFQIKSYIETVAWARCEVVNKAEQDSLRSVLDKWGRQRPPLERRLREERRKQQELHDRWRTRGRP